MNPQSEGVSFAAALKRAKIRQVDMVKLTGKDRRTVWRWCRDGAPAYAWTIVRQQQQIRDLTKSLAG